MVVCVIGNQFFIHFNQNKQLPILRWETNAYGINSKYMFYLKKRVLGN